MLGAARTLSAQGSLPAPLRREIQIGGRTRSYLVDLPPQHDGRRKLPVVLVFHGGGGNATTARTQTGMSELARKAGFIAVYPNGTGVMNNRLLTWNAGTCCGYAARQKVDEAAFVRALLDTLQATLPIDPKRIYATGMSNGGMMAYLVGCRIGDRIAAVAPVSGELTLADCRPARPVSLLVVHGTADDHLPYAGGVGPEALDRHEVRSVESALGIWRGVARCPESPKVERNGSVMHATYAPCADRTAVELYRIAGGPHAWPGGQRIARMLDEPSQALDATKVVWDFFAAHPRR